MRVLMLESVSSFHAHTYFTNHNSCQLDPNFISAYFANEQAASCYSEPFHPDDLKCLIGSCHKSPLGLVPKPHTNIYRMIQDMSYLQNKAGVTLVNHGIISDNFLTASGSSSSSLIPSLPPGCLVATFDISAAYHLTLIHPNQQHHLCVFWKECGYVDQAVMFGLASSAGVFGSIANMLVAVMKPGNMEL